MALEAKTALMPLFPLPTLLFPGTLMSLQIFEPRYLTMVKNCLKDGSGFAVVLAKDAAAAGDFHRVATYATISDWNALPNHLLGIQIQGQYRVRILETKLQHDGLILSTVDPLPRDSACPVPPMHRTLVLLLQELRKHPLLSSLPEEIDFGNASTVSLLLSSCLPFSTTEKQGLLECEDPLERLDAIKAIIDQF